jgi:hypothetical protein
MSTPVGGIGATGFVNLEALDVETALMAIQSQRANLLEDQLKDQLATVQERNVKIEALNNMLAKVRAQRPDNADDTESLGGTVTIPGFGGTDGKQISYGDTELVQSLKDYGIDATGAMNQGEFDQLIATITSKIDGLNSSQQMDMLRLQSLTNKRNEAFDLMTNFLKKSQDSRSSIVGNMR